MPLNSARPAAPTAAAALTQRAEGEYRRGDLDAAAATLEKAIAADRRDARAHWLLGNIAQDRGQLDRAISSYRRALRAAPQLAEAHNDLGTAYFAKGWSGEAEQCYRRALELQPHNAAAAENLGTALRAQGKLSEARREFTRALKLRLAARLRRLFGRPLPAPAPVPAAARAPGEDADAEHALGKARAAEGKRAVAIRHFGRAIALRSSAPEYHVSLGNVLTDERRYDEALQSYRTALLLDPGSAAAMGNIARVLHERGHFREAEEVYRMSVDADPDAGTLRSNHAATLLALGLYAEAEAAARKALDLGPRAAHTLLILASALVGQRRPAEALAFAEEAQRLDPRDAQAALWLGEHALAFGMERDLAAGRARLERARDLDPQNAAIHISLSRVLLLCEEFERGWEEYEWRKRESARSTVYARFPYPEWDGGDLRGRSIAVNGEQGIGDEIMFASCVPDLLAQGARVTLYCHRRLEKLFRRSFPGARVVGGSHRGAESDPFPEFDDIECQIASGSLPRKLRRSAQSFPRHAGYLRADPPRIAHWKQRLDALGPGRKVGVSWRGGTPLSDETRRTLALRDLATVIRVPGVRWVSLQHGDCEDELRQSGQPIHHWPDAIADVDELAALMCALDLRISVCNTQVHLAGALGREVWVLAPVYPDWRYGRDRESMLWYPATRMIRQRSPGDWCAPLAELERSLRARSA